MAITDAQQAKQIMMKKGGEIIHRPISKEKVKVNDQVTIRCRECG